MKSKVCLAKKGRKESVRSPPTIPARISAPIMLSCLRKEERKRGRIKSEFNHLSFVFKFSFTLLHNPNEERCNEENDERILAVQFSNRRAVR